jgi:hypothetical protein
MRRGGCRGRELVTRAESLQARTELANCADPPWRMTACVPLLIHGVRHRFL